MPKKTERNRIQKTNAGKQPARLKKTRAVDIKKRPKNVRSSSNSAAGRKVRSTTDRKKSTLKVPKTLHSSSTRADKLRNLDVDVSHREAVPATKAALVVLDDESNARHPQRSIHNASALLQGVTLQDDLELASSVKTGLEKPQRGRPRRLSSPLSGHIAPFSPGEPLVIVGKSPKSRGRPRKDALLASNDDETPLDVAVPLVTSPKTSAAKTARRKASLASDNVSISAFPEGHGEFFAKGNHRVGVGVAPEFNHSLDSSTAVAATNGGCFSLQAFARWVSGQAAAKVPRTHSLESPHGCRIKAVFENLAIAVDEHQGDSQKLLEEFAELAHLFFAKYKASHRENITANADLEQHQTLMSEGDGGPKTISEVHKRGRNVSYEEENAFKNLPMSVLSPVWQDFCSLVAGTEFNAESRHQSFLHPAEGLGEGQDEGTQKEMGNNQRVVGVSPFVSNDQDRVHKGAYEQPSKNQKLQAGSRRGKCLTTHSRHNRSATKLVGDKNDLLPVALPPRRPGKGRDEPEIQGLTSDFPRDSGHGSIQVDTSLKAETMRRGGSCSGGLAMPAYDETVTAEMYLRDWETDGTQEEEPRPPLEHKDSVAGAKVDKSKLGFALNTPSQELPQEDDETSRLRGSPQSDPSTPPHSRLLPQGGARWSQGGALGSAGTAPVATLPLYAGHGLPPLCAFPINCMDGFTALDGVSLLAHTRAVGKHISLCETLKAKDPSEEPVLNPLGCLAAQTQRSAAVREDMVKELLLTLSSDQLFGDTLYTGVTVLQQVLREKRQYTGVGGQPLPSPEQQQQQQDPPGSASLALAEDDGYGEALPVFPREVPNCFLPVSGAILQRAHARIHGGRSNPSVGDCKGEPMEPVSGRYTTLSDGIPPAPCIDIEHTYRCRGSFIPHRSLSVSKSGGPAESTLSGSSKTKEKDESERCDGVAVSPSGMGPAVQPLCGSVWSSLPLIALNPEGDLHHHIHRRFVQAYGRDSVNEEDADDANLQPGQDISQAKANSHCWLQSGAAEDGVLGGKQKKSEGGAAVVAAEGTMDIDRVLRRGEHYIRRIPMPDVEWRYGPFE